MNPSAGRGTPGFTLLELILALAAGLLLLFLASQAIARLVDAGAVDSGAQMVANCLSEARQDAITQTTTVEVRLYNFPFGTGYSSLQLHWRNPDGTTPPINPLVTLPAAATIDATPQHSSLITGTKAPQADVTDPHLDANTRCFHLFPDGTTDLAAGTTWLLTVRAMSQSDPAHFPANWASVEVDPLTGRAQLYRP